METKETVTTEVVNLSNKNEKLCQELTEIDHLAQQLERHKEEVLETADKELGEAKVCLRGRQCSFILREHREREPFDTRSGPLICSFCNSWFSKVFYML